MGSEISRSETKDHLLLAIDAGRRYQGQDLLI
jgi:hypothetical protein